jgi:hypothetical protein
MHGIRGQILAISLLTGLGPAQLSWAQPQWPDRGLDKNTVETRLGAPQRVEGPVGEPPITKWVYADFIVVFEYDHVVHTVKRQTAVELAPVGGGAASPSTQTTPSAPAPTAEPASPVVQSVPASPEATNNNSAPAAGAESGVTPDPAESTDRQTTGDTLSIPQ